MATKTDELFATITDRLIAQIESNGAGTWTKPWTSLLAGSGIGRNAQTKAAYKGYNQLILMATALDAGYPTALWATYKQWEALGGQVRKGEKGTTLVKWGSSFSCNGCDYKGRVACDKDGHVSSARWWASPFTVFNVAQQDGFEYEVPKLPPAPERHEAVETFIAATGASITHAAQDRAFYRPSADTITLPLREQFETPQGYYGTALHELGHWTGHESRLDRQKHKAFGDEAYAGEELVAELTSTFLAAHFQVEPEPHVEHASYLASWLKVLKADPKNLYTAAKQAQAAVDYLTDLTNSKEAAA